LTSLALKDVFPTLSPLERVEVKISPVYGQASHASPRPATSVVQSGSWLLLDARGVEVPMASNLTFVLLSSLKPLFFTSLTNELCFSVNAGA